MRIDSLEHQRNQTVIQYSVTATRLNADKNTKSMKALINLRLKNVVELDLRAEHRPALCLCAIAIAFIVLGSRCIGYSTYLHVRDRVSFGCACVRACVANYMHAANAITSSCNYIR